MNHPVLRRTCLVLALLAVSLGARASELVPVTVPQLSHLGFAVEAPGTEGWMVSEQRRKTSWHIMYRHASPGDESRTSYIMIQADQYKKGKFARKHGSLEQLAQKVLRGTRSPDDERYTEKWAELARADVHGTEAWRMRVAWEERNNPYHPGAMFLMEGVQHFVVHPQDPDRIMSIRVSTRRKVEQEALSADALAGAFVGALKLE